MTNAESALNFILAGWPDSHTSMDELADELETGSYKHRKLGLILRLRRQPTRQEIVDIFGAEYVGELMGAD